MKSSIKVLHTGFMQVNTLFVPCIGGYFVTDPGGDIPEIASFFNQLNTVPRAVVLTHAHFDHIAGLQALRDMYPNIDIIIHKNDAFYLGKNSTHYHAKDFSLIGLDAVISEQARNIPDATHLVSDNDEILGWQVIHTPGHSPGSMCLYSEEDGVLLSGDTLFRNGYGRTDLHGGDSALLGESLMKLSQLPPNTIVYPGHGPQTTIGEEFK